MTDTEIAIVRELLKVHFPWTTAPTSHYEGGPFICLCGYDNDGRGLTREDWLAHFGQIARAN